jgi:hydrogenase/urease accessory protein HupE
LTRWCLALALLLGLLLRPGRACAHDETVSTSDVAVESQAITWKVEVGLVGLRKVIALPNGAIDEGMLAAHEAAIADYLMQGVEVVADGRRLVGRPDRLEPIYEPSIMTGRPEVTRVALQIRFETTAPPRTVTARVQFFSGVTSQHRALIRVSGSNLSREHVVLGPSELVLASPVAKASRWAEVSDFLRWGTFHIFIGYDHIAFLVGLLLATTRLSELVKVVTSFTLAHSATILLSALDVVRVPSRLTEAMIACSIVYIAVENLWRGAKGFRHRWLLAFGFGLVHGLGFATELRVRLAALSHHIVVPVVSFNLGVELGQLALVALLFPLLDWVRSRGPMSDPRLFESRLLRMGSMPVLGLGLFWLVQRVMP